MKIEPPPWRSQSIVCASCKRVSGDPRGFDECLRGTVVCIGEHARVDELPAQRSAAACADGERVVGEVSDVRAQEVGGLERRALAGSQDARGHGAVERIGDIGGGGGAVAERAEHELHIHGGGGRLLRAEVGMAEICPVPTPLL